MARRTAALKPQLNQIRTWAREGRTDAWIAYQLGTTSATVQEFRFEYGLDKGPGNPVEEPVTPELVVQTISFDSPPPLPPLEPAAPADESADPAPTRRQRRSRPVKVDEKTLEVEVESESASEVEHPADGESDPDRPKRRRRRGGRGGGAAATADGAPATEDARPETVAAPAKQAPAPARRKTRAPASYQGSVVAGAVLVLDPAVTRSAAWRAHWADAPAFDVVVEDDQIVLRRRTAD
jgi:hypothetical protein